MNVFEAYEKHVRKDMIPKVEKPDMNKMFELEDDTEPTPTDNTDTEQREAPQFKLSDEDREALVADIVRLLRPDGGE